MGLLSGISDVRQTEVGGMNKSSAAAISLFLLLYIFPLGARPIIGPDEFRYGEIPREMLASGDWVVPHLNGLRYFEKPVLGYWFTAVAMSLFGDNTFAIRFPSAVAAGISALLIFLVARKFASGHFAGIVAAVVLLTCGEFFVVGTVSVLDNVLTMFVTASMVFFFFAAEEQSRARKSVFLTLFGISCGLAFLTKGFVAFAIPVVAIAPFLLWDGRWKELFKIPWLPIVSALLVAAPWCIMIHLREPDFWNRFFWNEHVKRFMTSNPQHLRPFWYYIPILAAGALPWTPLFPHVISNLRWKRSENKLLKFSICWFLFPFLFFSTSGGKLGTYILPCFPPLALIVTAGLLACHESDRQRKFTAVAWIAAAITAMLCVALIFIQMTSFPIHRVYGDRETWKFGLVVTGLLSWAVLSVLAAKAAGYRTKLVLFCAAPVIFMFSTHFFLPDKLVERRSPSEFLMRQVSRVRPDTVLVSDNNVIKAVCWCYKRDDSYLLGNPGELRYGLSYHDSKGRQLDVDQFRQLIAKTSRNNAVILITRPKIYKKFKDAIPKPEFEDTNGAFVFVQFGNDV